jgi:hypothetical protein
MPSVPSGDIISGEWTAAFTSSFNFSSIGLGVPPGASRARQATVFGQDGSPTSAIGLMSGALWTGADLFMGFVLGPTPRMLDMRARTALIACLVPRTLLYFPTVSLTAGTTGWFLADWFGFTTSASPMYYLVVISLAMPYLASGISATTRSIASAQRNQSASVAQRSHLLQLPKIRDVVALCGARPSFLLDRASLAAIEQPVQHEKAQAAGDRRLL